MEHLAKQVKKHSTTLHVKKDKPFFTFLQAYKSE